MPKVQLLYEACRLAFSPGFSSVALSPAASASPSFQALRSILDSVEPEDVGLDPVSVFPSWGPQVQASPKPDFGAGLPGLENQQGVRWQQPQQQHPQLQQHRRHQQKQQPQHQLEQLHREEQLLLWKQAQEQEGRTRMQMRWSLSSCGSGLTSLRRAGSTGRGSFSCAVNSGGGADGGTSLISRTMTCTADTALNSLCHSQPQCDGAEYLGIRERGHLPVQPNPSKEALLDGFFLMQDAQCFNEGGERGTLPPSGTSRSNFLFNNPKSTEQQKKPSRGQGAGQLCYENLMRHGPSRLGGDTLNADVSLGQLPQVEVHSSLQPQPGEISARNAGRQCPRDMQRSLEPPGAYASASQLDCRRSSYPMSTCQGFGEGSGEGSASDYEIFGDLSSSHQAQALSMYREGVTAQMDHLRSGQVSSSRPANARGSGSRVSQRGRPGSFSADAIPSGRGVSAPSRRNPGPEALAAGAGTPQGAGPGVAGASWLLDPALDAALPFLDLPREALGLGPAPVLSASELVGAARKHLAAQQSALCGPAPAHVPAARPGHGPACLPAPKHAPAHTAGAALPTHQGARGTAPPITYLHVYSCRDFSVGIFCLPQSATIPLHDHPGMTVLSRLLVGRMQLRAFDWIDPDLPHAAAMASGTMDLEGFSLRGEDHSAGARLARLVEDVTISAPAAPTEVLFSRSGGNIHTFTALTPCAVLDVLAPPYDVVQGRNCTYYREVALSPPRLSSLGLSFSEGEELSAPRRVAKGRCKVRRRGVKARTGAGGAAERLPSSTGKGASGSPASTKAALGRGEVDLEDWASLPSPLALPTSPIALEDMGSMPNPASSNVPLCNASLGGLHQAASEAQERIPGQPGGVAEGARPLSLTGLAPNGVGSLHLLEPFQPPEDFVVSRGTYSGPKVIDRRIRVSATGRAAAPSVCSNPRHELHLAGPHPRSSATLLQEAPGRGRTPPPAM